MTVKAVRLLALQTAKHSLSKSSGYGNDCIMGDGDMGIFLNRGNEEFRSVLNSKIYVDKTDMIEFFNQAINTEQRYVCVSRARRFGKSVTANMIAAYFEKGCDSRSLFEDKKLGQIDNWNRNLNKYDTIRIDIADIRSQSNSGDEALDYIESSVMRELYDAFPDIENNGNETLPNVLSYINESYGASFIIIIDEWDCLFRDDKDDYKVQQRYIGLLRALFKGNRAKKFTALAYITGILPIKRYNSESALNNFYEYTMADPSPLAKYVGFTEDEVKVLCEKHQMNYELAKEWYDGYSFNDVSHIYNPNSVVKALFTRRYEDYWSQTVAFSSLGSYINVNFDGLKDAIKTLIGGQRQRVRTGSFQNDMVSFKNRNDVLALLVHLGYLAYDIDTEEAYIPNKEVRTNFEYVIEDGGWDDVAKAIESSEQLLRATIAGDSETVARAIDECHMENTSIIAYNDENSLAAVIGLSYYTARKDYEIIREMPSGYGFADMVFIPRRNVDKPALVIELKWNKTADTAITQIKAKKYPRSLEGWVGEILLVGISYDKATKKHECVIEKVA